MNTFMAHQTAFWLAHKLHILACDIEIAQGPKLTVFYSLNTLAVVCGRLRLIPMGLFLMTLCDFEEVE